MKLLKSNLSEKLIINKHLKKLNFKNKGTFDFENDGAYLELKNKNAKLYQVTNKTCICSIYFSE